MSKLYETINTQKEALKNFQPELFEIPKYIIDNLKHNLFYWQREAMENLFFYENPKLNLYKEPTHLMFNMATGSGKTMVMAAAILYFYKKGYRHFIFFVNQNNIVDKTENNFINNLHNKYLFKENIIIDGKRVKITKVETFSENTNNDIQIKFTTIHKLHNDVHIQKENKTTLDNLHKLNIVMLADEAHNLNAETKKKNINVSIFDTEEMEVEEEESILKDGAAADEVERKGWEHTTIELILKKNNKNIENKNVLLEFTATLPNEESVQRKYEDKIIYKYDLKSFLSAGYTKEIVLISSTLAKKERILQALIFNWYRHILALKNDIPNFKSVILFRSKTIAESEKDYEDFKNMIINLSVSDLSFLKNIEDRINDLSGGNSLHLFEMGKNRMEKVLSFIKENKISNLEIVKFLKESFSEKNIIITNSNDKKAKGNRGERGGEKTTDDQDKLLNNLEDKDNHVRAIFTVNRLTEGWDVLNLYDIVRLYEENPSGGTNANATPESTTKEKQLIGRGVRYFPFKYKDKQKNKRKFDDDIANDMRPLEELYYYTYDEESRYISHLKNELRKDGYIQDNKEIMEFSLKESFKKEDFYKNVKIWYNKQISKKEEKQNDLKEIKKDFDFIYILKGSEEKEEDNIFIKKINEKGKEEFKENIFKIEKGKTKEEIKKISDLIIDNKHIFYKAINIITRNDASIFRFNNISNKLKINNLEDTLEEKFLGDFFVKIILEKNKNIEDIGNKELLNIFVRFLSIIEEKMNNTFFENKGGEFEYSSSFKELFGESKIKSIEKYKNQSYVGGTEKEKTELFINSEKLFNNLKDENWYVIDNFYGTSEEIYLIEFIKNSIDKLNLKYEKYFLLRNEEVYKIYDFKSGQGFMPDFILFLKSKSKKDSYYQIFIEPKGQQFLDSDGNFTNGKEGWKENFLLEISKKYGGKKILKIEGDDRKYNLYGVHFYNQKTSTQKEKFEKDLENIF